MAIYINNGGGVLGSSTPYLKNNGSIVIPDYGYTNYNGELKLIYPAIPSGAIPIYNQSTLETFMNRVYGGEHGLDAIVIADFTLTQEWTPTVTARYQYSGTFDGGGHTISGLTITSSSNYQTLFGRTSVGTIKNLTLNNLSISGGSYLGTIVAINYGTIENCHVIGGTIVGTYFLGGIVSDNEDSGTITNCTNSANISSTDEDSSTTYIGGIASRNFGEITGCANYGDLFGVNYIGGIVGSNGSNAVVTNCTNSGTVSGTSTWVGQIIGYDRNTASSVDS